MSSTKFPDVPSSEMSTRERRIWSQQGVLVVSPTAINRIVLGQTVRQIGYQSAETDLSGLTEQLHGPAPAAIVLDCAESMPLCAAFETDLRTYRKKGGRIVLVTAKAPGGTNLVEIADAMLRQPVTVDSLGVALDKLLNQRG